MIRLIALLLLFSPAVLAEDALVVHLQGSAFMMDTPAARAVALKADMRIPEGKIIKTGEAVQLMLALPGGHQMVVAPKTMVRWSGGKLNSMTITVLRGQTIHRVSRLPENGSYRVATPVSVSGVRGTEFAVGVADNGAARVSVNEGEVAIGEDEDAARILSDGEEDIVCFLPADEDEEADPEKPRFFERNRVRDTAHARELEGAAAKMMKMTSDVTANDYAELGVLGRDVAIFATRRPTAADVEEGLDLLIRGLKVYRRIQARAEVAFSCREFTKTLAGDHGISDADCDFQYKEYLAKRRAGAQGFNAFVSNLEKLSMLLKTAKAVNSAPVRLLPLPW